MKKIYKNTNYIYLLNFYELTHSQYKINTYDKKFDAHDHKYMHHTKK